jgi:hypothetical protein
MGCIKGVIELLPHCDECASRSVSAFVGGEATMSHSTMTKSPST